MKKIIAMIMALSMVLMQMTVINAAEREEISKLNWAISSSRYYDSEEGDTYAPDNAIDDSISTARQYFTTKTSLNQFSLFRLTV